MQAAQVAKKRIGLNPRRGSGLWALIGPAVVRRPVGGNWAVGQGVGRLWEKLEAAPQGVRRASGRAASCRSGPVGAGGDRSDGQGESAQGWRGSGGTRDEVSGGALSETSVGPVSMTSIAPRPQAGQSRKERQVSCSYRARALGLGSWIGSGTASRWRHRDWRSLQGSARTP